MQHDRRIKKSTARESRNSEHLDAHRPELEESKSGVNRNASESSFVISSFKEMIRRNDKPNASVRQTKK
jgi:hypothetical protein